MKRIFELTGRRNIPSRASLDLPPLSIPKKRAPKIPEKPWRLLDFPVEIQLTVLGLLSKNDLASLSLVNKHLAEIAQPILHREADLSCPPIRLENNFTPLLLFVRTLLNRPDLAQAVQHLHFDGYDFPRRIVDEYPTTFTASLTREDKLKALTLIHGSLLNDAVHWSKCFLAGQIDSIVALLLALTPKVKTIYLGEDFSVETDCLRLLLDPEGKSSSIYSTLHNFEHLRQVTVNNHAVSCYHRRLNFTDAYQSFFHLDKLERLSISTGFPKVPRAPLVSTKKLNNLKYLDLQRGSVAELGQILALVPNLTDLKYAFARNDKSRARSNPTKSLDLGALRESLEGHRLGLEKLELLTIDLITYGTHSVRWAFKIQGPPLKLYDFSNLRLLTVPWIFIAGNSMAAHPTPLRYIIPESVVQLSLTDDLHQERCWGWASKDMQDMVTNYLHDVDESRTALASMYLVGPFITKILTDEQLFFTRLFARSAGIDFRAVEMTIPERDELREKNERARRYAP
ncbi:DNA mismatch repair [Fusarium tjaetaba]|uniref:DNA mismatch repair n=1 Tax=Fusarium tjaetaba TaxID=1567544 RepID=A0A8H5RL82_9HYPO|nr:DNA mismatch repair [Fusarium tjaetaba]KAF5635108.1 DNA mismatch repair [Fusarium tjaetaba]